jgi:intraflagellar transport protein 80
MSLSSSLGDDNALLKFDISNDSASQLAILDGEATTFDCSLMTKTQGELLAVGHVNGEMKILNKFGKVEKVIQAHKGAVTCIKWSHDGQTIASAGEEGTVKVGPADTDLV